MASGGSTSVTTTTTRRGFSAGYGRLFSAPLSEQELCARGILPTTPRPPSARKEQNRPSSSSTAVFHNAVHAPGTFSSLLPDAAFTVACSEPGCKFHQVHEGLRRRYDSFRPYISEKKRLRIHRRAERRAAEQKTAPVWNCQGPQHSHDDVGVYILEQGDQKAAFRRGHRAAEEGVKAQTLKRTLVQEHLFEQFVSQVRHSIVGEAETGSKFVQEKLEAVRQARSPQRAAAHSHKCHECGHRYVYM